ncbi:MAG: cell division protein ZapA [Clostridia bacterium]|nr:cell division protein ZapA [Clostridia bacterium]
MAETNRETVKIYGQEYTITGTSSSEQIREVAAYVDGIMNEIAAGIPNMSASSLAVLTAVNIADDFFNQKEQIGEMEDELENLQKDADHYEKLWEEVKANFRQYKDDAQGSIEQLKELQRIYNMKNVELSKANEEIEALKSASANNAGEVDSLNDRIEELKEEIRQRDEKIAEEQEKNAQAAESESADMKEIKRKYKELESSFFDIQMDNMRLKNELDNLKKNM